MEGLKRKDTCIPGLGQNHIFLPGERTLVTLEEEYGDVFFSYTILIFNFFAVNYIISKLYNCMRKPTDRQRHTCTVV
jgi:hypothetical protein